MSVSITGCWRTTARRLPLPLSLVFVPGSPDTVEEPISVDDANRHLKQPESTPEDADVARWIRTARSLVERTTRIALVLQTWDVYLDRLGPCPGFLELPWWPVQSVDAFVVINADETETAMDPEDYFVKTVSRPAIVGILALPSFATARPAAAVRLRLTVGFDTIDAIPPELVQAMYLLVGHFTRHRGDETAARGPLVDSGAQAFLERFVLPGVA
jgi:uncharacterized phiE125 gp8 family phage protein